VIIVDPANNTADRPEGRKTLTLLVKRYSGYKLNKPLYPELTTVLLDAVDTVAHPDEAPTTIKALNAVLAQVNRLPKFSAELEGEAAGGVFVSIAGNWDELAQTVLDILYETPDINTTGSIVFGAATRGMPDCGPTGYVWRDERRYI
jgi:hypothetical protein